MARDGIWGLGLSMGRVNISKIVSSSPNLTLKTAK